MKPIAQPEITSPAGAAGGGAAVNRLMKWLRVLFVAVFAVLMIRNLPKLEFENSLDRWVRPGSPALRAADRFPGPTVLSNIVAFSRDPSLPYVDLAML